MRKWTKYWRKSSTKCDFKSFCTKAETDQKYEEMGQQFEETVQQIEILKFLKKAEADQKYEDTDKKWGN